MASICEAVLIIADDYGDNHATMRCQLEKGHTGKHCEVFFDGTARVEWFDRWRSDGTKEKSRFPTPPLPKTGAEGDE